MILPGDVLTRLAERPAGSVQCVVTSAPYWQMRNYEVPGQWGMEPTPEEHIDNLVTLGRALRRVMRKDGMLWFNYGDGYSGGTHTSKSKRRDKAEVMPVRSTAKPFGLPRKNLMCLSERIVMALQADGWYLRSRTVWWKRNVIPDSAPDRPTVDYEFIYILTPGARYYSDFTAIEPLAGLREGISPPIGGIRHVNGNSNPKYKGNTYDASKKATRRIRSVWDIPTQKFQYEMCEECKRIYDRGEFRQLESFLDDDERRKRICECGSVEWLSHFATFPEELARRCILAGTSEKGACPECGAPWERVIMEQKKVVPAPVAEKQISRDKHDSARRMQVNTAGARAAGGHHDNPFPPKITTGWQPTCDCPSTGSGRPQVVPCVVLDPFLGSGTVGKVAQELGREWIGIELNPDYCAMAEKRTANPQEVLRLA